MGKDYHNYAAEVGASSVTSLFILYPSPRFLSRELIAGKHRTNDVLSISD